MSIPVELYTRFGQVYAVQHKQRGEFSLLVTETFAVGVNASIRGVIARGEAKGIGHRSPVRGPGEVITLAIRNITRLYPADVSDQAGIDSRDATAVRNGVQHSASGASVPPEQRTAGVFSRA